MVTISNDLHRVLSPIALDAFSLVAREHGHEQIYSVALFTSPDYRYVADTVSTIAGLERTAEGYLRDPDWRRRWRNLRTAMVQLKWNPCDSPYHCANASRFQPADDVIQASWQRCDDSDASYWAVCHGIQEALERVVREVASSGLFHSSVVFNVLMGDQSDEARIANARKLNAAETVASMQRDLAAVDYDL
jgi:hypothetical protein